MTAAEYLPHHPLTVHPRPTTPSTGRRSGATGPGRAASRGSPTGSSRRRSAARTSRSSSVAARRTADHLREALPSEFTYHARVVIFRSDILHPRPSREEGMHVEGVAFFTRQGRPGYVHVTFTDQAPGASSG